MNPVYLSNEFKWQKGRSRITTVLVFLVGLVCSCSNVCAIEGPEERAKEFLSNVYTGKQMKPEEWLTRGAQSAPLFNAFGGLERMIQQSTARAQRYGGLKSIDIRETKHEGQRVLVKAEIRFVKDHKSTDTNAVAASEDIIWDLPLVREGGAWKVAE